ncbi:unnamed protein product, partial [Tetraodon nigroviridis]
WIQIWDRHGLSKCLDLTSLNKHGRVYDDAQFGCLSWSRCEQKLLYVAEKSRKATAETRSVKECVSVGVCVRCCVTVPVPNQDRCVYHEDWGEALTDKSLPVICSVSLQSGCVSVLEGVLRMSRLDRLCGLPAASLFSLWVGTTSPSDWDSSSAPTAERLSGDNLSVSCPRLSPDAATLIYLQGRVFGPHNQCLSLQQVDPSVRPSVRPSVMCEFAGVYEALPACCWSADGQRVVFSSACRNQKDVFMVDRRTKSVTSLSDSVSERYGSWRLLAIQKDLMVVCCSSPSTPPTLRVGFLPSAGEAVTWQTLHPPARTFQFKWTVLDVSPPPEEDNTSYRKGPDRNKDSSVGLRPLTVSLRPAGLDFGAILVKPSGSSSDGRLPLVVFVHGPSALAVCPLTREGARGPHSQFPAEWNSTTAGLVRLGFAVLMVNYRGSTGFGQDGILSLIGRIGSQDVKDVQRAVLAALQADATLDPRRVAAIGGSHGGFLSCHLVGQYPGFYRACALRNPVINAATLLGTSDIVDWRYTSAGLQYSHQQTPTAEALAAMLEKSPITHAAQIKAPVLLMLGGRDRRVAPHQGLELYRALKSRASPVRLLWFPEDGHSLSRVDTQADCFLNTALWLQQHV